jgi:hypothetical protein
MTMKMAAHRAPKSGRKQAARGFRIGSQLSVLACGRFGATAMNSCSHDLLERAQRHERAVRSY